MKASIVIPAYNEEKNIERVLLGIKRTGSYELIVVDDGSKDNTAKLAKKHAKVIRLSENRGKGYACRLGVKASRGSRILFMDGDGQFSPHDISKMLKALEKADLVVGKRNMASVPLQRRLSNFLANLLMRKTGVEDGLCGFRAVRKEAFGKMHLCENRYAFESEMNFAAAKAGLKIGNVPVDVDYSDYSGMPFSQSLKVFLYLVTR